MHGTEDVEVILPHVEPPSVVERKDSLPLLRTVFYTLDISTRFLARTMVGTGSVEAADALLDGYWRRIFQSGNASLRATGRRHFKKGEPYVVMSNHASLLDIPALMGAVPNSLRMVMKQGLRLVPVWGPALVASGFVPIDRKNRERAISQLEKAKAQLRTGVCIWISPEGTRARDGRLARFKKGGFHVAMDLGVPILPAWIEGTSHIVPPGALMAKYHQTITVHFGAPIPTTGRSKANLEELMTEVRSAIVTLSGRPDPLTPVLVPPREQRSA